MAKQNLRELRPLEDHSPRDSEPHTEPVDLVSARLAERWLYLRSKELVALSEYVLYSFEAFLKGWVGDVDWIVSWPGDYLAECRANDTIKPLEESLLFAENDKEEGNMCVIRAFLIRSRGLSRLRG
jgi:hypothetical protein